MPAAVSRGPLGPSSSASPHAWGQFLAGLFAAGSRNEMAAIALAQAERVFGCTHGSVLWCRSTEPEAPRTWHGYPARPTAEDLSLLARAAVDDSAVGRSGADRFAGRQVACEAECALH